MSTRERIIEEISKQGPLLPVEIASKTGLNSFLIKGYLEELVKEGKLRISKDKIGSDFIYYLEGQEEKLKQKYSESKDSIIKIKTYEKEKINETPELQKKRREFIQRLQEIEKREQKEETIKKEPKFIPVFTKVIKEKVFKEETLPFLKKAERFLNEKEIKILEIIDERKKSKELIAIIPSKLGNIKQLIIIKDKKKISKSDLALAYTKSLDLKLPVIFITNGKLTGTGKEYLNEVGEFLKIKYLQ